MQSPKPGKSFIAALILLVFSTTCLQAPAYAAILTSQEIAAQQALQLQRDQLQQRLLRADVAAGLLEYGVTAEQVEQRINSLTAAEIQQVNGQLDALPAGGNVLATVVLVLLILILLEVLGATDIFTKI